MRFMKYSTTVKILNAKKIYDISEYMAKLIMIELYKKKDRCPYCDSIRIIKYGRFGANKQRYKCSECRKTFSSRTNTILSYSKKDIKQWMSYIKCMIRKLTIRSSAGEMKISNTTSFYWRHKILKLFKEGMPNDLSGIVEIKTSYRLENYKGQKRYNNRKLPMTNGFKNNRISTICCVDRDGSVFSQVVCRGFMSYKKVDEVLKDKIAPNSELCIDNNMAYISFANRHRYMFHKVSYRNQILDNRFHIFSAIKFLKILEDLICSCRGVATRYLNFYIAWIKWIKITSSQPSIYNIGEFASMFVQSFKFRINDFRSIGALG